MSDPRFGFAQVGTYPRRLLRDEEAAGSNPATPTQVTGHLLFSQVAFCLSCSSEGTNGYVPS
jgi:hypothetical protein